ncbi:MAG: ABC transporter ATP-binding protein [Nitrospirota bacterium]|nr:MAG: ABC transporter ATP-binding protein [Nitrospirota bacterium]
MLEINGLNRRFGGLQAVKDVSFSVREGQIKAVIGPNGAGKTTLFNLISGYLRADSGITSFMGKQIQTMAPHKIARSGISRTFQHIRLFHEMTALENVMVGRHTQSSSGFIAGMFSLPGTRTEEKRIRNRALEIMDFIGIADLADTDATSLAFGQQRGVELARALASDPKLMLLDEPAAGLNMKETAEVAVQITKIRDLGITVLIVEHDMSLVMNISDEIVVLNYGEKIAEGLPLEIQKDSEVIKVYLGDEDA